MPSSPPSPPPANANTGPANAPEKKTDSSVAVGLSIASMIFGIIFAFVWHLGAASLSYAKYGSIGWAILDFFFASFYYPFYAFFLNTPAPSMGMMGGRRLRLPKLF